MPYKNKADQAAAARRHYEANRDKMIRRASVKARDTRDEMKAYVRQQKEKPCTDCGGTFPWYVMQFDHVRGEKLHNVGDLTRMTTSMKVIREEIAKCEVVCANCHAIRTYERRDFLNRKEQRQSDDGLTLFTL